jgi:Reverse transcriptase (RNA-dependent DNA polymerase).
MAKAPDKKQREMKRINGLYGRICELDNLYLAYSKARKGKGGTYGVRCFERNLTENINQLQAELLNETYKTSEYDTFTIFEPKERLIFRLPFRDRVVHHAIMNILEDIWVKTFTADTYSCIKTRGIHGALRHLKCDLKDISGTIYCLKLDIKKFYPSVDHEVMKNITRKKIKDVKLLRLLDGIIDSAPGLPIGNYLSQFLANLYLTYFDHWLKEEKRVKCYCRYADDVVVLDSNKQCLHDLLNDIREYLYDKLKLRVKGNYQVFPVDVRGIDFVGYVFRHKRIFMRKSIKKRLCKQAARLNKKDISVKEYKRRISPRLGWAKHCDSNMLLKKIIKYEEIL